MNNYTCLDFSTERALFERAACYRNLVVFVVFAIAGSVALGLIATSWKPFLGIVFILPVLYLFIGVDAYFVSGWRNEVLSAWSASTIDIPAFMGMLEANPGLPKDTISGMMKGFPSKSNSRNAANSVRGIVTNVTCALGNFRVIKSLLLGAALASLIGAVTIAIAFDGWWQFLACVAMICAVSVRLLQMVCLHRIQVFIGDSLSISVEQRLVLREILKNMDWDSISNSLKREVLDGIRFAENSANLPPIAL